MGLVDVLRNDGRGVEEAKFVQLDGKVPLGVEEHAIYWVHDCAHLALELTEDKQPVNEFECRSPVEHVAGNIDYIGVEFWDLR